MQKAYGRQLNAKLIMQGWEIKFSERFTVEQLLYALDKYTDKHDDFPSPANLIEILQPEEPTVTEAQFIAAQKWQERNHDWSQYTEASETIAAYRKQNDEKRAEYSIVCEKVRQIANASVKRINKITVDAINEKPVQKSTEPEINKPTTNENIKEAEHWKSLPREKLLPQHYTWWIEDAEKMAALAKENPSLLDADYWEKEVQRRKEQRDSCQNQ